MLTLRRFTSAEDRIVSFKDASVLRATDLDISQLQAFHIAEEGRDFINDALVVDEASGQWNARNRRIINVANPVDDGDALNYATYKKDAQGAYQARLGAESARDLAKEWATKMDGQVAGEDYSSKYYAGQSKASADVAGDAETQAKEAQKNATAQASDAKNSAKTATTKASEASASATAAKASETKAKTSETNAKASETNAKTSETKAKTSEDNAKLSETNAKASETKAGEILASVTAEGPKQIAAIQAVTPTEVAKVTAEGAKQVQAVEDEGTTQVAKVTSEGTSQVKAVGAAGTSEVSKVTAEGSKQVQAVKDQGTASVSAVTTEGTAQVNLAKAEVTKATEQATRAYNEAERAKKYADQASQGQEQADWNETDPSEKSFIKNKPTLFTKTEADGLYLGKTAKASSATTADSATKATQDANGNVINTTYATKTEVTSGLAGKAPTSHTHTIANVTGLQDALDGKLSTTGKAASATVADSANSVAWDNVTGKPTIPPSPKAYITETWSSGSGWYRVWSDGFIEQGGSFTGSNYIKVSLYKAFSNTNYNVSTTMHYTQETTLNELCEVYCGQKYTSSLYIHPYGYNPDAVCYWRACGY